MLHDYLSIESHIYSSSLSNVRVNRGIPNFVCTVVEGLERVRTLGIHYLDVAHPQFTLGNL